MPSTRPFGWPNNLIDQLIRINQMSLGWCKYAWSSEYSVNQLFGQPNSRSWSTMWSTEYSCCSDFNLDFILSSTWLRMEFSSKESSKFPSSSKYNLVAIGYTELLVFVVREDAIWINKFVLWSCCIEFLVGIIFEAHSKIRPRKNQPTPFISHTAITNQPGIPELYLVRMYL